MTTEMYGAPFGIQQAEQGINQNILAGLKAQQALGEIAMQPAERRLKESHARLYEAEALQKESQLAYEKELAAIDALVAEKRAQGLIANVDDLPPGGLAKERSQADPIKEFLAIAQGKIPTTKLIPLYDKVAEIQQHEAGAANQRSNETVHKLDAQAKISEAVGSLAMGALKNPDQYPLMRAEAARRGIPPAVFPETFNPDMMRAYVDASMKAKDKMELERKSVEDEAQRKLWKSTEARNNASARLAGVRYDKTKLAYDQEVKNGGKDSPSAKARREEMNLASEARRKIQDLEKFAPIPIDPKDREPNTNYTARDGSKVRWVKKLDGTFGAIELSPPPGSKKAAALSASMPKAQTNLLDDDDDD